MKMKALNRTLVIGDIHGAYKALTQVLERASVTENDRLIFLGDYVDGWSEPVEVIRLLMKLKQTNPCVFLRGNHESLTLDWMHTHNENLQWLSHGGLATVAAYQTISNDEKQEHRSFLEDLAYYHLDDENRLFVHGGFTNQRGVEAEFFKEYLCWDRTLWEMALAINPKLSEGDLMYPKRLKNYKEIFIGHTPVTHCGFTIPTQAAKVWNIDTGAAFQGKVSIMDVDSKEFWQSDAVTELYPNEEGRNGK